MLPGHDTPAGREGAGRATEGLNREVFEQPGVSGDQVRELFDLLTTLRAGSGDPVG